MVLGTESSKQMMDTQMSKDFPFCSTNHIGLIQRDSEQAQYKILVI